MIFIVLHFIGDIMMVFLEVFMDIHSYHAIDLGRIVVDVDRLLFE
jgi:hypothetical protein